MDVNETRNCLVTDILLISKNRLNTFENGKTQLFNSGGVVKPNLGCKPNLDINCKLVLQIWLAEWNIVPGSKNMLIQEHSGSAISAIPPL